MQAAELEWKKFVYSNGGSLHFCLGVVEVKGLTAELCRQSVKKFIREIGSAVKEWGAPLQFAIPGEEPIVITESLADIAVSEERDFFIFTASTLMPQAVVSRMNNMLEYPRAMGGAIVRLRDERQIVVADESGVFYPDFALAVQQRREEYWLPSDLEIMRQAARRESSFCLTYIAHDHKDVNDWYRITTEFTLFSDRSGNDYYHDCVVKDFAEVSDVFNPA